MLAMYTITVVVVGGTEDDVLHISKYICYICLSR